MTVKVQYSTEVLMFLVLSSLVQYQGYWVPWSCIVMVLVAWGLSRSNLDVRFWFSVLFVGDQYDSEVLVHLGLYGSSIVMVLVAGHSAGRV